MRNCGIGLGVALLWMAACASSSPGTSAPDTTEASPPPPGETAVVPAARVLKPSSGERVNGVLPLGDKLWTCTVKLSEKQIRASAKTKGDAKAAATGKCGAADGGDACRKIACSRNI